MAQGDNGKDDRRRLLRILKDATLTRMQKMMPHKRYVTMEMDVEEVLRLLEGAEDTTGLRNVLNETEPKAIISGTGDVREPARHTQSFRAIGTPGAATVHTILAIPAARF